METITLSAGTIRYRVTGPQGAEPPIVFVHGFLVNGTLWRETADALAGHGIRAYAPDWPLGAHTPAMSEHADLSPRAVARLVLEFIEALGLQDVTLVGNDTGGALCQFALDHDAARIGRVVLTNCDAFEQFPPPPFGLLVKATSRERLIRPLMGPMRARALRHSMLGFGGLVSRPLDADTTRAWIEPCLSSADVRRDTARFAAGVRPAELRAASERLGSFAGPALLVWGGADPFFKPALGRRLRDAFADARLVELPGVRAFVPHDAPQRLAEEIVAFTHAAVPAT